MTILVFSGLSSSKILPRAFLARFAYSTTDSVKEEYNGEEKIFDLNCSKSSNFQDLNLICFLRENFKLKKNKARHSKMVREIRIITRYRRRASNQFE